MVASMGERFARAIASKDAEQLTELLSPELDFRGLTPGRVWESSTPNELVHQVIFGHWFEDSDEIEGIEQLETSSVVDTERVGYQFAIKNPDGRFLVEQQAYLRTTGDRIGYLRILCSGYRPVD